MNSTEFNEGRKKFTLYLLPGVFGFLLGLCMVLSILLPEKPHPQRSLTVQSLCVLAGIAALGFGFFWFRKSFIQLRRLACPSCQELMTRHVDVVLRTGRCPVCGEHILSDVYDESFQPARTQSPRLQGDLPRILRRQKVLAYLLILVGLAGVIYGISFNGDTNPQKAASMFGGAILAIVGVFIRGRIRQQIPVLAITNMDKAEFQKLRKTFAIRNFLARLIGTFGAVMLFAGISLPFYDHSGKSVWVGANILLTFGALLVYCANLLYKKPE